MIFNRHYVAINEQNHIISGWSDGPEPDVSTDGAILLTDKGGYQFRLYSDGEENPNLMNCEGVFLFKWDAKNKKIVRRTEKEIQADIDAIPAPEPVIPMEERIEHLEKTLGYHEKVIEVLMDTIPKPQQVQIAQVQKAMFGAMLNE